MFNKYLLSTSLLQYFSITSIASEMKDFYLIPGLNALIIASVTVSEAVVMVIDVRHKQEKQLGNNCEKDWERRGE